MTDIQKDRKMFAPFLPQYKLYHSCEKGKPAQHSRSGSGGVTIAVHEALATQHSVELINFNTPAATAHCKAFRLQPPGSECIIIWGVYMLCNGMHKRIQMYELIKQEIRAADEKACKSGQTPYHTT